MAAYVHQLLSANEQVVFQTRKHWSVLAGGIIREALILLALVAVAVGVNQWAADFQYRNAVAYGLFALMLIVAGSAALDVLRWRHVQCFVTDRRVIRCSGLLSKDVLDSSLSKINDVMLKQSWLGRLFGYGTVEILTASDEAVNVLERIADPVGFKAAMLEAKAKVEPGAAPPAPAGAS